MPGWAAARGGREGGGTAGSAAAIGAFTANPGRPGGGWAGRNSASGVFSTVAPVKKAIRVGGMPWLTTVLSRPEILVTGVVWLKRSATWLRGRRCGRNWRSRKWGKGIKAKLSARRPNVKSEFT